MKDKCPYRKSVVIDFLLAGAFIYTMSQFLSLIKNLDDNQSIKQKNKSISFQPK